MIEVGSNYALSPEEALSPRELRLERSAFVLRLGAFANLIAVGLVVLLAAAAGFGLLSNLPATLHRLTLLA